MTTNRPDTPPTAWSTDDPRLTAYALGELGGGDRAEADAAIEADALLAAEVHAIRALAVELGDALSTETSSAAEGLSDRQRFAIRNAARRRQSGLSVVNTPKLWPVLASVAAVVAAYVLFSPRVGTVAVSAFAWAEKVRDGSDIEHLQDREVIDTSRFGERPTLWTLLTRREGGVRGSLSAASTSADDGSAGFAASAAADSLGPSVAIEGSAPPGQSDSTQLGRQVHLPVLNFTAEPSRAESYATPAPLFPAADAPTSPVSAEPAADPNRKIIKDATLAVDVDDTTAALGRIDTIAVQSGGYVIETRTDGGVDSGRTGATVKFAVPVDNFEAALGRLRTIGAVASEESSGVDVSSEYTDVQSRIANLEATQARVREFLAQAKTVEEALQVNARLTEIEGQLAELKGRMTYLAGRAAYSTITVALTGPAIPTRTPTITPTATTTPTPTPGPPWSPAPIARDAFGTLRTLLQALAAVAIWLAVVGLPIGLLAAAGWWAVRAVRRRG